MNPDTTPKPDVFALDATALPDLARVVLPVTLTTALADFLFWDGHLGLSVGVFFAGLGLLLFFHHRQKPGLRTCLIALLLSATCVQSAIALSLSNFFAATALTLALAGEVFHPQLGGLWPRLSETLAGLLTAPARWIGVAETTERGVDWLRSGESDLAGRAGFVIRMLIPTFILLAIFGAIFAAGNAVFGDMLSRANQSVADLWKNLNVTPLRVFWWLFLATAALGLFYNTQAPEKPRFWTLTLPRFARKDARLATWQTAAALLAVNALFCMVNTLDAIFLWGHGALPAGVNPSDFVHSGVNSLIAAVVLSAVVIAGMFQQDDATTGNRWLKRLAYLWVLQNFVLIGGVLWRLMQYTRTFHLTEKRIYVVCFLALVGVGFLLLAWFVQKRKSFNWLLGSNAVATVALFFVLQFTDVAGWVARTNVARWEKGASIDIEYLANLGPTAWPELIRVARSTRNANTAGNAKQALQSLIHEIKPTDWRAYQWQKAEGARRFSAYLANP